MILPLRDSHPSHRIPWITTGIIVANAVIFLYKVYLDPFTRNGLVAEWGLTPSRFALPTLLTYMFLHGTWFHVISNLWLLWIFGDNVEALLGKGYYLLFYLLCGVAAGLLQMAVSPDSRLPIVGASGALAGVMGAYLVKFPHARITTLLFAIFIFTVEAPAALILIIWFVMQVISGIWTFGQFAQGGVAWFAHVGGFVAGALLILVLPTARPYATRRDLSW